MRNLHTSRTSSKEPASSSSSSARIPYDRSTSSSSTTTTAAAAPSLSSRQHPQMPTLAKRATLTPKLAANKPPPTSASNRQTVTLATPVPRKSARPDSYIAGASAAASIKDNHASTTPSYFQNSIAPRSGPRQSRVDSPNSSSSPADPSVDINWDTRNGPPATNRDSKFFYASDAPRSAQPIPAPAPTPKPALPQKGPVFFYANGDNLPAKPSPPTSVPAAPFSPPLATSNPDPRDSKFMYANGTPDLQPSLMMTSGSGSVVSTSSRVTSTRPGSGPQSPAAYMPQRTTSPPKISGHPPPPPAPPSQSSIGPSIAERRNMIALSAPQLGRSKTDLRRISAEVPQRRASGHSRSSSLVAEPASTTQPATSSPPVNSPLPSPMSFSNPTISMASVLQAADDFAGEADDNESMASGLASPRSANGNDPLSELVANARRERKVQDLQITNASLEAINRTLERQLRKQTNELRRYKRMSRAARLSSVNTAKASSRVPSDSALGETPEGPLNDLALSDLSEDSGADPEDGYQDESELSESDSTGSAQTGPSTAMRDARHRKHDEKRLQVDLFKHQQLLVDSQKMNQSLKRCLGWTEELIREGKRALEYQVRISEVDIGGRVAAEEGEQPYIYDGAELWDHNQESGRNPDSDGEPGHSGGEADVDADETMKLRIERLRPADESDGNKNAQDRDNL
ncbi:hypothetical protein VM1G_11118 [Cytospora mali]|uniref:Uncharacterized protein n=1 Tax=Cytospora mali TaxID=578113 RepID=A0A194VJI8_CYTMA|nr:hypothetical protein VM1G_11118 [Valsa mali]